MAIDYYCNYGIKVKQGVLESFKEYDELIKALETYGMSMYSLASYVDSGDSYNIDEAIDDYNASNEEDIDFVPIDAEDVISELEIKLNELFKAFARKYRGYGMGLMKVDVEDIYNSTGIGNNEYHLFYITNEYKENVFKLGDRFDYVGGY